MKRSFVVGCLAMMVCAASAQAFVVSFTGTVPTTPTDFNTTIPLAKFDPSLGTLQMVVVRLNASLDATLIAENRSTSGPAILTGSVTQSVQVTPPLGSILSGSASTTPTTPQTVAAYDGVPFTTDPLGADTFRWTIANGAVTVQNTYTVPADLTFFTGTGNLNYGVLGDSQFSLTSNSGNIAASASATIGATITVEYTYVPEPATLGLVGMGLMMVIRRRR